MEEKSLFTIRTTVDKSDYRKFVYISMLQSKVLIVSLAILVLAFLLFSSSKTHLDFMTAGKDILKLLVYIICGLLVLPLMIEYKVNKIYKTDKTGLFGTYQLIRFYEDFMIANIEEAEATKKIKYDQIYRVLDAKEFIIFFNNAYLAFVIRKKDVDKETQDTAIKLLKEKFGKNFKKLKIL